MRDNFVLLCVRVLFAECCWATVATTGVYLFGSLLIYVPWYLKCSCCDFFAPLFPKKRLHSHPYLCYFLAVPFWLILSCCCAFAFVVALCGALGVVFLAAAVLLSMGFKTSCLASKQRKAWRQCGSKENEREKIKKGRERKYVENGKWILIESRAYLCMPTGKKKCPGIFHS